MDSIKFAFLGTTNYSKELLLFLIENKFIPAIVFSMPEEFNISYSDTKVKNTNYADLKEISKQHNIPYYEIDSKEKHKIDSYSKIIESLELDVILVLGWYYMIPKKIRELSKFGAWGIHASLLPKYAGGAPLNWAIINGEEETGVTLFRMEDGVDDGDIISQRSFSIEFEDSIKEVYEKATNASKEILLDTLMNYDNLIFTPQNKNAIELYPQRRPEDGEIDLKQSAQDIYNFIRAQSSPYPGAYINTIDKKKLIIEKARIED